MRSGSKLKLFGVIFDGPAKQKQLRDLESEIGDPEFWNNPEKSQRVMQERKRLEQAIANSAKVAGAMSDIDTLFELSKEGEDVTTEIDREFKVLEQRLEALETGMLLSGENDARDAIITIHPGAGGNRESGLGRNAPAPVPAMGGEKRLPVSYYGPAGGRGRRNQIRHV